MDKIAPNGLTRTLALVPFLFALGLAQVSCDASEVRFDFSAPGSLSFQAGYPVANLGGYLHLFDAGPLMFLPTQVLGGSQPYRLECTITTGGGGGGGALCGAGNTHCFRLTGISGSLPPPLDPNTRVYVMVQVVSGTGVINHVPSPTPLGAIPDNRGLASIPRNTTAVLWIYILLRMDPLDAFLPDPPVSGTLTFTYSLRNN